VDNREIDVDASCMVNATNVANPINNAIANDPVQIVKTC